MSFLKDTIFRDGETLLTLEIDGFTKADFDVDKKTIEEKEKNVKDLSDEIELLSKNNRMLKLLSSLSANKQTVIEYRNDTFKENGSVRCPVCGSKTFSTMEESLILKEADEYIKQNGEVVKEKEANKTLLQTEIETLYQKIINRTKSVVSKVKETLEKEINNLKILKDETQPYFDAVKVLQQSGQEIKVEEITEEKVKELLVHVEKKLLRETEEQEVRDAYQQILMVLGYKFENETIQQTYEKVKNLITRSYEVTNFSYELFVSKLNSIDSILANQILCDLKKKLKEGNENNKNIDFEIKELQMNILVR